MLDVYRFVAQNNAMISVNSTGYFITGSDTDVGKTYIGCELIRQIRALGYKLEVRKPAESGCKPDEFSNLQAQDALKLGKANLNSESMHRIAPYRFRAALAPPRAARLEGHQLQISDLIDACSLDNSDHLLIVEGAGGFYSPLAENALNADLASALQLAIVIVVKDQIGAVNQALMTVQAVESRHLNIAAIIMNQVEDTIENEMNNAEDLTMHCTYPVFRCLYNQPLQTIFS